MATVVSGEFEVELNRQKPDNPEAESEVKGSGVYVAIERVTGTLDGRAGTFILHHRGVMTRGVPELSVTVAPDSGTGELTGLTGEMQIKMPGGKQLLRVQLRTAPRPLTIKSVAWP